MRLMVHPGTSPGPVKAFDVTGTRPDGRTLRLSYRLDADLGLLRLPAPTTPGRADNLWHRTCFEAFLAVPGAPGYTELNFSPSGEWAAYTFASRRAGMCAANLTTAPVMTWQRGDGRLTLDVHVCLDGLLPESANTPLRLALAAVIEEQSGTISYWALRHPEKQPDFHHPGGFVLELGGTTDEKGIAPS